MGVYVNGEEPYNKANNKLIFISIPKEVAWKDVCGVYMISLGDHFYIGKSINIAQRALTHVIEFQALTKVGNKRYGKRKKIFKYLLEHPNLNSFHLTVLAKCDVSELGYMEKYFIRMYSEDKKMLNTQTYTK